MTVPFPAFWQMLALAGASLLNRRGTALLTILAVACSVALLIGVETIRQGARTAFERTVTGTDLIVGARSGPLNLLLYSIFRIGDATSNVTFASWQAFARRPEVAWTIPISLGDSHRGFRVMGTNGSYFDHYRYGDDRSLVLAEGQRFSDLYDAVIGADVAETLNYRLGQKIVLSHGLGAVSFAEHADRPFVIAGILARTGTPVDRTVHVSLEAITAIHLGWESGARSNRATDADAVRALDLTPKDITAFLVGARNKVAVLRLQRAVNSYGEEPLLAIIPGVALSQLWSVLSIVEQTLTAMAGFVVAVGLLSILTGILTSLNERRREMAVLRAVGARPGHIFLLLVSEAGLLALLGAILGAGSVHLILYAAGPALQAQTGLALATTGPGLYDLAVVGGVTIVALLLGAIPAWRAFRNSLADGLTVRI